MSEEAMVDKTAGKVLPTELKLSPEGEAEWLKRELVSRQQWSVESYELFLKRGKELNLWRKHVAIANRTNISTAIAMVVVAISVVVLCALIALQVLKYQ